MEDVATRHSHSRASLLRGLRLNVDVLVVVLSLAVTVTWSLLVGKEMNYDQLNYHFYLPYEFLGGRLAQDFMAANAQSYLNPLAYVPFFLMVTHGWHSLLITATLATAHALNIVLVYFIAREAIGERQDGRLLASLAAALAFASPVFLVEAGTSFADVTTTLFVLMGLLLTIRSAEESTRWTRRIFLAGLFLGLAGGLKLSNLVFGPPCAVALIFVSSSGKRLVRAWILLGIGAAAGLLIAHGYWGWQLWKEFGNPFFPLFNEFFRSPDFPAVGGGLDRFVPGSLLDAVLLPFRMLQLRSWIYIESVSPDIRFATLYVIAFAAAVIAVIRRIRTGAFGFGLRSKSTALVVFFVSAYVCWLWTSGNGRYGLAVSLLCGPVLVVALGAIITERRVALATLISLLVVQAIHFSNGDKRWSSEQWTRQWFDTAIPDRLVKEPYLYISVGGSSNSYIVPFLASGSAFTNPIGSISFDLNGPGGERLKSLFSRYEGRIRVISLDSAAGRGDRSSATWINSADTMVARLGYAVDGSDCLTISSAGLSHESGQDFDASDPERRWLTTCRLTPRPFELAQERARVTAIVEDIARWCPKLFKPAYSVIERFPTGWFANYPNSDILLLLRDDGAILATQTRTSADQFLGTLDDWEHGRHAVNCSSLPARPRDVFNFD